MAESRLINVKRNMVGETIYKVVSLLLPFLTRTVIIYVLGALYLGLNSLYGSILTILSLAELGFGSAMVFSMYEPIAKGNKEEVCALLNLYRKIYRIIGCVILLLGLAILPFLSQIIKGEVPSDVNIYALYLIFLTSTVLSYFLYAYKSSLLVAHQRSDIDSNVSTLLSIATNITQLIALYLTRNYYAYCLVIPLSTIVKNLIINRITNKKYPEYHCYGSIEDAKLLDIKKRVGGLFIYKVCYVFRDSIDSIVISAFLGLIALAKFNNYFYITNVVTGFIVAIKTSMSASVGNSMITEPQSKNYNDFKKCQLIYMLGSAWCTVCIYCLTEPFIKLWIGTEYILPNYMLILFCGLFYCYKMGDMCAVYRQAAGLWWQDRYRPIVEAVTNLVLNITLVQIIGMAGVVLSTIFCLVFINSFWASRVLYKFYFKDYHQRDYIVRIIFYGIVTLTVMLLSGFVCQHIPLEGISALLVRGGICICVSLPLLLILFRFLPEYKESMAFLKIIFKK